MAVTGKVIKAALKKVEPSEVEKKAMEAFKARALSAAHKLSGFKPQLCGSAEKGTWLPGKLEIDLFLLFPTSLERKGLEKQGLEAAKKIIKALKGKPIVAYAEHPYARSSLNFSGRKFEIDVVPAYEISDPSAIQSAVDRTPHHVVFVKKNLSKEQEAEVRLLKQFCKTAGCYGADLKTQGFSGYLCELLIVKFGSFSSVIKAAAGWSAGAKVSLSNSQKQFHTPLTIIDPVDSNRNVAAAVSPQSLYTFSKACSAFLKIPSIKYFSSDPAKPYSVKEVKRAISSRGTRPYLFLFPKPKNILDDVLYTQGRKTLRNLEKLLSAAGFSFHSGDIFVSPTDISFFLEISVWSVPRIIKHKGPSIYSKQSKDFLNHYSKNRLWIEGDDWFVETERAHTAPLPFFKYLFSLSQEKLSQKGIPSNFSKTPKIFSGINILKPLEKREDLRLFLRNYFETNFNPYGG
ncbi:MAG: CCA tRNA nucleotidyltransferase [Candidatus Aenigmarchaeota archaeon]|nr:CCA tRNA nucleotidyltransferase [Candidatus Aenigmarchaeota archaeon]